MTMASADIVAEMLKAANDTVEEIALVTSWPRKNVEAKLKSMGLHIGPDDKPTRMQVEPRLTRPTPPAPAPAPKPPLQPIAMPPEPTPATCSHATLVVWAKGHPKAPIRAKGEKFEAMMLDLIAAKRTLEAEDAARARREKERRDGEAEVEQLKKKLRDAQERLRKPGTKRSGVTKREERNALIREWASDNGFNLGDRGRIPAMIVDAYDKAQQAATA